MEEVLGYQKIESDILNDFSNSKLHHAIIFSGIKGIGKFSFAKKLAAEITNNKNPTLSNPNCLVIKRSIGKKNEQKKDIGVDEIRKINDFVQLTAGSSNYRVIIIDCVDHLNKNSSNALLKSLEEPPTNVFFFLINHNPAKILDTVKSRCKIIKINPPSYSDFCQIISNHNPELNSKETKLLFDICFGSIATALKFNDSDFVNIYKNIAYLSVDSGKINAVQFIDNLLKKDEDLMVFEALILLFLQRVVTGLSTNLIDEEQDLINKYLQKNQTYQIFSKIDKISETFIKINRFNLDKKQSLVNILNIL